MGWTNKDCLETESPPQFLHKRHVLCERFDVFCFPHFGIFLVPFQDVDREEELLPRIGTVNIRILAVCDCADIVPIPISIALQQLENRQAIYEISHLGRTRVVRMVLKLGLGGHHLSTCIGVRGHIVVVGNGNISPTKKTTYLGR